MKYFLPILLLSVAACGQDGDAPLVANQAEAPAAPVAPAEPAAPAAPALAGDWAVTAFNGSPLTQVFDMTASFAGNRLTIASECVRMAWTFAQDGNLVTFKPAGGGGCARTQTYNEDQVEKAVAAATMAMFSDDGREVQLSGSGGTITLAKR